MEHIEPAVIWLASVCVAIGSIWTMLAKIKKPFSDLAERVSKLEEIVMHNRTKLDTDKERIDHQEEVNQLLLRGVNNLIQHELTANHTPEMRECSKEIEHLIYSKGGSL